MKSDIPHVWSTDIDEYGIVRVLHVCGCRTCGGWGYALLNMAYVDNDDYIRTAKCPTCSNETVYIITYMLLAEPHEDPDDDY